ncbi:ZHX3 [Trypoxylus dichotomus]
MEKLRHLKSLEPFVPFVWKEHQLRKVSRFKEDDFDINDAPHLARPSDFDEGRLNALVYNVPRQLVRKLAIIMEYDQSTIVRHCS